MTTEQTLPKGWENHLLKQLCSIKTGDKDVNQGNENGIYPFFTCAQEISNSDTFSFEGEAILIAGNGNFNVKFYDGKFEAYQRTYVLQAFKNVDSKYLFYFIKNKLSDITKGNRGSTIKYIRLGDIANYPITYPTNKETQQAIVNKIESLFAEIDAGVGSLKTAVQQLAQYRQSLLKNAFNGELTKAWREENADTLPTAEELLAQIQTSREQHHAQLLANWQSAVSQWEENGKEGKKPSKPKALTQAVKFEGDFADLPNGWGVVKLEHLSKKITDGEHFKPPVQENGVYFLSAKDIRENGISLDDPLFIGQEIAEKARFRCDPEKGDIVIVSRGATVGRMCIVNIDEIFCLLGSVILIKPLDFINNVYLNFAMKSPKTNQEMISLSGSTAQQAIYLRDIKNINIPVCSLAEQTQIVAILENKLTACDRLAADLAAQLKQAELLKQSVLKAAFSGKLLGKQFV